MTDKHKSVNVHYQSAREKAAGLAAGRAWHQELMAAHLLKSQTPIKDQPVNDNQGGNQ